MAKIEPARSITGNDILAPKVASFSSRGPSPDYADIIKVPRVECNARHRALVSHDLPSHSVLLPQQPDIAAPGASILAAVEDSYGFKSGTSMAAPHVTGIIALLKALHPNWSPAALKSAIITTGN